MIMKKLSVLFAMALFVMPARADEGMWLLPFLSKLNIADMKAKGLKLEAEDIYNVNGNSLKDAIVIFGDGCTGEVVSPEGLVLTNHHCGYGQIQALSSVENDYLKNGFWAMSRAEEIPAPGLTVTFIRRIEEVTDRVLGRAEAMGVGPERDALIRSNSQFVMAEYRNNYPEYTVAVRPFMGGNQYFVIVSEVYRDIRLVGTPPTSMGKFGGDTDNWMWPRHTDDFSMFRIYAGADNRPAAYSPDNKPYEAPVHLKISVGGVHEDDFTMIMGFPGSTDRYMTTYQMKHLIEVENANRILIRGERQKILREDMMADDAVRLKYAAKYASSSNYWKNSIGKNKSLVENRIPERKAELESRFQAWAENTDSPHQYQLALAKIKEAQEAMSEMDGIGQILSEALATGSEIVMVPSRVSAAIAVSDGKVTNKDEVLARMAEFYKNYNEPTDRRAAKRMFALVREMIPAGQLPSFYGIVDSDFGGDTDAFVDYLYDNTIYTSREKLAAFLDNYDGAALDADPAARVLASIRDVTTGLALRLTPHAKTLDDWHGVYIKGLTEMDPQTVYYPDANFTIRLTYGTVLPYEPRDGVVYKYYTTLKGVIEKEDPSNPLEFTVPQRVKDAYAASDYGIYGEDAELRTDFITNNDITGGNSGSPVMNARGELVGLAFDGNWEAMSGDIVFEPELQRCINVDIRYVLWTIDKFAGAGHLLSEMTIVK